MKIIHLPTSVGTHGYSLACAERRAGYDSVSLVTEKNYLNFKTDIEMIQCKGLHRLLSTYKLIKKINNDYDIIHFNFGSSLYDMPNKKLDLMDLPFYKKPSFMTFNGSDLRQLVDASTNPYTPFSIQEAYRNVSFSYKQKKKRTDKILKYVKHCFVITPDLLRFLPEGKATLLPGLKEAWLNVDKIDRVYAKKGKLKIVHAPTNRKIKGTDIIVSVIDDLNKKYDIELILVENMSHSEALKVYQEADLIIDQIRIGWYGGFAVEAMKMGKPVAVFINDYDLKYVSYEMKNALSNSVINVNPDNLKDKLIEILENRNILDEVSKNAYDYVCEFHNPDKLIKIVIDKYLEYL